MRPRTETNGSPDDCLRNNSGSAVAISAAANLEDKTVIKQHRSRGLWLAVLALGGLVAITSYPPAEASHTVETSAPKTQAPPPVRAMTQELAQAEPEVGGASDAACSKVRKRLWVDGEGWIVRRVSICR